MHYTILHTEASKGWGGQEKRILDEILFLREKGHRFFLACQPDSAILKEAQKNNIPCLAIKMPAPFSPKAILSLRRFVKENGIEIVNTHSSIDSWLVGIAGLTMKGPLIVRTRHLSTPVTNKYVYTRLTDLIVTTAESIKMSLTELGISANKIFSIPTGVNEVRFNPEIIDRNKVRRELGISDGEIAVGNIGILRSWKGYPDFLDVAQKIAARKNGIKFFIAGDGPRKEEISGLIKEKGLEGAVTMLGYRVDTPQILSALDVFLFTSYANEGVPQVILQALSMGKGVVATDIGGVSEAVFDGKTGLLSKPHDISSMTAGVLKLIEDEPLRKTLGENGRKLVLENFTIKKTCERMEEVYKLGLNGKR